MTLGNKIKADWKMERVCVNVLRETVSALLVLFSNDFDYERECWVPKSIIGEIEVEENAEHKTGRIITLPTWWINKNEPCARRPECKNDDEWAADIRTRKAALLSTYKKPIFMAYIHHQGEIVKEVSPACAAEIVAACDDSYSLIMTRNMPISHLIALALVRWTGKIY